MNTTSPPDDALDALLSDFFKGQMKKPWPAAPATSAASEPSALANASSRREPAPVAHDPGTRARYTLAASVAILLGTCWTLSNGFQAERPAIPQSGSGIDLHGGTADGTKGFPGEVKKAAGKHAENNGFVPPKLEMP